MPLKGRSDETLLRIDTYQRLNHVLEQDQDTFLLFFIY